jgi:hypothetical protein
VTKFGAGVNHPFVSGLKKPNRYPNDYFTLAYVMRRDVILKLVCRSGTAGSGNARHHRIVAPTRRRKNVTALTCRTAPYRHDKLSTIFHTSPPPTSKMLRGWRTTADDRPDLFMFTYLHLSIFFLTRRTNISTNAK